VNERASAFEFEPGVLVRTCSAEDLVVLKVFAGRPQDWIDVEGTIVRQGRISIEGSSSKNCAPCSI